MLPKTQVLFRTEDSRLQQLYDTAVRKCLNNLNMFGPDQVLVEGGGYEKIWLETQPMGGEMYARHNMTAALNNHCSSCARSAGTAASPAPSRASRMAASSPSSTSSRASASPGLR